MQRPAGPEERRRVKKDQLNIDITVPTKHYHHCSSGLEDVWRKVERNAMAWSEALIIERSALARSEAVWYYDDDVEWSALARNEAVIVNHRHYRNIVELNVVDIFVRIVDFMYTTNR